MGVFVTGGVCACTYMCVCVSVCFTSSEQLSICVESVCISQVSSILEQRNYNFQHIGANCNKSKELWSRHGDERIATVEATHYLSQL